LTLLLPDISGDYRYSQYVYVCVVECR